MPNGSGGNIGTLWAHIGMDTRRLAKDQKRADGMMRGFTSRTEGSMKRAGAAVGSLTRAFAALGVSVGAGMLIRNITRTGIAFEQAMTTAAGVMRATGAEMDMLTAKAREMGEKTEWSASQAAGALQFLGMAGFQAVDASMALPGVLDLATAGNIELARAADIASNALTAMGLPVEELTRVNDVFVGTITRSNVNMEMMAEAFKYAAPVARGFGYEIEELSGLIGMLGNAGIQGSMAGTQLAMAMQRAGDVAKKFGYESADLVDVLARMKEEGRDTYEILGVFGQRAGRAGLVLAEATDETRKFQETLRGVQGESKQLADRMRDTVGGAFKELKSVIESVAIDAFGLYGQSLKGMIQDLTGWVRENKARIAELVDAIIKVIGGLLQVLAKVGTALFDLADDFAYYLGIARRETESTEDAINSLKDATETATKEMTNWWKEWMKEVDKGPDISTWQAFLTSFGAIVKNAVAILKSLALTLLNTWTLMTELFDKFTIFQLPFSAEARNRVKTVANNYKKIFEDLTADWAPGMFYPRKEIIKQWAADMEKLKGELFAKEQAIMGPPESLARALITGKKPPPGAGEERGAGFVGPPAPLLPPIEPMMDRLAGFGMRMRTWADETADAMRMSFSNFFFDALTGELNSFGDYWKSFWDQIMRMLSERVATSATDFLMNFVQQGAGFLYEQSPGFVGPPASAAGWGAAAGGASAGGGDTYIMNVQTPDKRGFQESQSQIMSSMAVMLNQAKRRGA